MHGPWWDAELPKPTRCFSWRTLPGLLRSRHDPERCSLEPAVGFSDVIMSLSFVVLLA